MADVKDDLEKEKPSTIKQGLQRWLIAAGVVFTLLCVYLFIAASKSATTKEEAKTVEVPRQTQEGELKEQTAISRFKSDVQNRQTVTDTAEGLNPNLMPTYRVPQNGGTTLNEQRSMQQQIDERDQLIKQLLAERNGTAPSQSRTPFNSVRPGQGGQSEQDAIQALQEQERQRAFKSLQSQDTLGNPNAFYQTKGGIGQATEPQGANNTQAMNNFLQSIENEPLEVKQAKVKQQIARTNQVLDMIRRGEIDPSNIPPDMLQMMQGGR